MLDFEKENRNEIVRVVLICKGYYDKEKYPSVLEALKAYYKQYYSSNYANVLAKNPEKFLLNTVLTNTMYGIMKYYTDRMDNFLNIYVMSRDNLENMIHESEWFNKDYETALFYRIVSFLHMLQMRGDGFIEIDTSEYIYFDGEKNVLVKDIIR